MLQFSALLARRELRPGRPEDYLMPFPVGLDEYMESLVAKIQYRPRQQAAAGKGGPRGAGSRQRKLGRLSSRPGSGGEMARREGRTEVAGGCFICGFSVSFNCCDFR